MAKAVLIIFPVILQTVINLKKLSVGGIIHAVNDDDKDKDKLSAYFCRCQ